MFVGGANPLGGVLNTLKIFTALFAPFCTTQSPGASSTKSSSILHEKSAISKNLMSLTPVSCAGIDHNGGCNSHGDVIPNLKQNYLQRENFARQYEVFQNLQPLVLVVDHMRPPRANHGYVW